MKVSTKLLAQLCTLSVFGSIFGVFLSLSADAADIYSGIKNIGGKCLDVQNGYVYNNGTPIQIWDCNGSPAQQWQVSADTNTSETIKIKNVADKCLDVKDGQIYTDEQPVWLYDCNGTPAQQWTVDNSTGEIRNVGGKCLDVRYGYIGTSGTSLEIYSCNGTNAQKWLPNSTLSITYTTSTQRINSVTNDAVNTWMSKIQSGPLGSPVQNGFIVNVIEERLGYKIYAYSTYAENGVATVRLNPDWFFTLSYGQQKKVLMHELVHVMGFGQQHSPQYFKNVTKCGNYSCFKGQNTTALYGGLVPLQDNVDVSNIYFRTDGWTHFWEGDSKLRYDLMSAATLEGYSDADLTYTMAALKDMGFVTK